ncbi:MAG: lysylphosphatidylglycerol synthase transmembrane domain-containing protein [Candidatus Limnocylindrales bacterium]
MKAARVVVGIAVSAVFGWATLTRVDLSAAGQALGRAALPGVAVAVAFAWLEIAVRAWRWRILLSSLGRVRFGQAFAYTCVGYFANTLLPLRLGDVARAYLSASALHLPRLATLGSIVTERLADGLTILLIAAGLGLVVTRAPAMAPAEVWLFLALAFVVSLLAITAAVSRRRHAVEQLIPGRICELGARLLQGAEAARSPRGLSAVVGSTVVAYACAVVAMVAVAGSVGLHVTPAQAAFAMAWIGLSTAIPAAPGSVGTYEFVGVSVLTVLGQDPATSLAAVVLLHVIGTLPVALVGLVMTWALHLRLWRLGDDASRGPEPAVQLA